MLGLNFWKGKLKQGRIHEGRHYCWAEIGEDGGLVKKFVNGTVFVLILGLALLSSAAPLWAQESNVVARVNGVEITMDEFIDALEAQYGVVVLEQLIIDQLISQKQVETGVTISDEEFSLVYEQLIQEMGGPEALFYFLYQYGITEDQLKDELRSNLLLAELAISEIDVTKEEVAAWFESNRQRYDQPETVTVSHILVETQEEAESLLAELQNGADFAALAMKHSLDPGTAANGGWLGPVPRGYTVEPFENMAFSLGINEYGIVETSFGWHIILVSDRTEGKAADLEEIFDKVEADYKRSIAPAPVEYLRQLESAAEIEIVRERYK